MITLLLGFIVISIVCAVAHWVLVGFERDYHISNDAWLPPPPPPSFGDYVHPSIYCARCHFRLRYLHNHRKWRTSCSNPLCSSNHVRRG